MMGLISRLFPAGLWMRLMVYALVFTLGLACGNGWATKRALERELQASADRQRENHLVLFEEFRRRNAEYKAHIEQQIGADAAAYAMLTKGKAEAERAAQQALASLRIALSEAMKQKETNDGIRKVNDLLAAEARAPDPLCLLDGRVRSILDYASGATDTPGPGIAEAASASIPVAASEEGAAAANGLTCDQLARGYVDLASWGREGWSLYRAWQEYWSVLNAAELASGAN
jgi:hypothetical protein